MTQTITALFGTRADASAAVNELIAAGIPAARIRTTPEQDVTSTSASTAYNVDQDDKGFLASLKDLFLPDEDRYVYAEAMHRGSIMVAVTADDQNAAQVEDILERRGTVEIEQHEAAWRKEGWKGAPTMTRNALAGTAAIAGSDVAGDKIQLAEEHLQVGKRQVNSGRVKIRSYVVETPVSEQVRLRKESVQVDKVAVDRALRPGEDPFKERTIESTATSEEAVVAKHARVTGEVRVVKSAGEKVETIQDTVRSTKIDVDGGRVESNDLRTRQAQK